MALDAIRHMMKAGSGWGASSPRRSTTPPERGHPRNPRHSQVEAGEPHRHSGRRDLHPQHLRARGESEHAGQSSVGHGPNPLRSKSGPESKGGTPQNGHFWVHPAKTRAGCPRAHWGAPRLARGGGHRPVQGCQASPAGAAGGPHCAEYATGGFRAVAAATPCCLFVDCLPVPNYLSIYTCFLNSWLFLYFGGPEPPRIHRNSKKQKELSRGSATSQALSQTSQIELDTYSSDLLATGCGGTEGSLTSCAGDSPLGALLKSVKFVHYG